MIYNEEPSQFSQSRDLDNLNDSIILIFNNDDKKNETIIDEKSVPPVIKNIDNKFNPFKEDESVNSEKKILYSDNLFDNFGFNQIKI